MDTLPILKSGTGWSAGNLDVDDYELRTVSVELAVVTVNVDYRSVKAFLIFLVNNAELLSDTDLLPNIHSLSGSMIPSRPSNGFVFQSLRPRPLGMYRKY